ncbi:hypothetical protein OsJ_22097 [Oryza sativa Japonica Group]|uniref:Cyclase-like protein 2 n=1 Tax=Oryza sativa subsp. japonica TaxID=39947 RepID=B9FQ36_ORYSJ|nr:hypothetical protein OsJ_22097 [Oryza sativa Japonica Group]
MAHLATVVLLLVAAARQAPLAAGDHSANPGLPTCAAAPDVAAPQDHGNGGGFGGGRRILDITHAGRAEAPGFWVLPTGPALLVDVPRHSNVTVLRKLRYAAEVMESLNIPRGVRRVLFRTMNTDKRLMWQKESDLSFVGFTEDGAQWLVGYTDIKLVGVDYLSVASYEHMIPAHVVFLKSKEIVIVEALKLDDVEPGMYMLHCLPLRLAGAEGSPVRCILIK